MDQHDRDRTEKRILVIVTAALLVMLVGLVGALIYVFSTGSGENEQFDIDMITSDSGDSVDISALLVPEFIGITSEGKRAGVCVSDRILYDISKVLAPAVSYVLTEENAVPSDETAWEEAANGEYSIFVRFHDEMPDVIVGMFSDILSANSAARNSISSNVYEMMIVPYSEKDGVMQILTRSADGKVTLYSAHDPHVFVTAGEMATLMKSYSSSLIGFSFAGDGFGSLSATEPLFSETVSTRNIMTSDRTAPILLNTAGDSAALLGVFGMNPDKVTLTLADDESASSYVGSYGVLYIRDSSFEYRAATGGGLKLRDITGNLQADSVGIKEYIRAAARLFYRIRDIDKIYAGGEAAVYLSSVTSEKGKVTVELRYAYDNIAIADSEPAIRAVFDGGVLTEAEIYTLSVRPRRDRSGAMSEWGFSLHLDKRNISASAISLVYRVDYSSESVSAEWCAKVRK